MAKGTCSVDGCEREIMARGWCFPHWKRWRRHGDPLAGRDSANPERRFWSKVDKTDTCWNWMGSTLKGGYGRFALGRKTILAHRFAYQVSIGDIPMGMDIDHRCHNRRCVNPEHLRPVTPKQNSENRRGAQTTNGTGIRGVQYNPKTGNFRAIVGHNNRLQVVGTFTSAESAGEAARERRNMLFTHNDLDRFA